MGRAATSRRVLGGAVVLLVLLAAVGLASRAHAPGGGGGARGVSADLRLEYTLLLIALLAVVVVPAAVYLLFFAAEEAPAEGPPPRRNWMVGLLVQMVAIAVICFVVLTGTYIGGRRGHGSTATTPPAASPREPQHPSPARFAWSPVIVVSSIAAALILGGAVLLLRRRAQARPEGVREALARALDELLEETCADLDPRSAVIAAYALMERVLDEHGLGRDASEAPREYLRRVLPGVGAGGDSVERLTGLYERARFSLHNVDGGMKDEAIAALTSLRDELRRTV